MTGDNPGGPVLFCFDGSEGSSVAMKRAAELISEPGDAVVLTVWEKVETRLALAGAFAAGLTTGGSDLDTKEEEFARSTAEEGSRRAKEHGLVASPMIKESTEGIGKAIVEAADQLSARLIVCGQRGRGTVGVRCSAASRTAWRRMRDGPYSSLRSTDQRSLA